MTLSDVYSALVSERGVEIEVGVPYAAHSRCALDIYRPRQPSATHPIVLFFYGGGWRSGERATYRFVGSALAARGIITVIPDYRLFPQVAFPAFVKDGARAFAWVADNLAQAGQSIIVAGHSAGAHTAALLALDPSYLKGQKPAGLVGLSGPYAFDPTTWPTTRDIFVRAAGMPNLARPVAFASSSAPPALLLHGASDALVKPWNSIELTQKLRDAARDVQAETFAGIGHMGLLLAISRPFRWRAPVLERMVAFVKRHNPV